MVSPLRTRFLLLGEELIETMTQGLPIHGVYSPVDANALHTLGEKMVSGEWTIIDETLESLLVQTAKRNQDTYSLMAPKVSVATEEAMSLSLGGSTTAEVSDEKMSDPPSYQEIEITPSFASGDRITLDGAATLVSVSRSENHAREDQDADRFIRRETEIISFDRAEMADGHTILLYIPPEKLSGDESQSGDLRRWALLILVTATKTHVYDPPEFAPAVMPYGLPLPPGGPLPSLGPGMGGYGSFPRGAMRPRAWTGVGNFRPDSA